MAEKHYIEQVEHTNEYLIPYFQKHVHDFWNKSILEIGCAEGGFLEVLREKGMKVMGVELEQSRVDIAKKKNPSLNVIQGDILADDVLEKVGDRYDIVVLRDVIEHVPDRPTAFNNIHKLIRDDGYLYITFPPYFSPFAGHQQNGRSFIKRFLWIHLLPHGFIRFLGKSLNEHQTVIDDIILNSKIGLSYYKFRKYYRAAGFKAKVSDLFLIRPIFRVRFGLQPRKLVSIPVFREFFALGCEYLLKKR